MRTMCLLMSPSLDQSRLTACVHCNSRMPCFCLPGLPRFSNESIAAHVARCSDAYVKCTGPRSFLQQMKLVESIKAAEDVAIMCEAADLKVTRHAE